MHACMHAFMHARTHARTRACAHARGTNNFKQYRTCVVKKILKNHKNLKQNLRKILEKITKSTKF